MESLLKDHAAKFVDDSSEYLLTVDRTTPEKLWIAVVTFYKGAKIRPNQLHKGLVVHFSGEAGADAGALRREFFEDALNEADNRLFEGEINTEYQRRISDYKWSLRLQECCLDTLFFRKDPVWPVSVIRFIITSYPRRLISVSPPRVT